MKKIFISFFLFFTTVILHPQDNGAYLIPANVYVGDKAVLILPLRGAVTDFPDVVLLNQWQLPQDKDIDFHRIVLERHVNSGRLLIEFTAYIPGILKLPVISVDDMQFDGLSVKINSLINTDTASLELSKAALTIAMPGSAAMIYITIILLVFSILIIIWFFIKGRFFLKELYNKWKIYSLFVSMQNTEKRLYKALTRGGNLRYILDKISGEFRIFLSNLTGINCRSMTVSEFYNINDIEIIKQKFPNDNVSSINNIFLIDNIFLYDFFKCCDTYRFSGADVKTADVFSLLEKLRFFLSDTHKKINQKKINNKEGSVE